MAWMEDLYGEVRPNEMYTDANSAMMCLLVKKNGVVGRLSVSCACSSCYLLVSPRQRRQHVHSRIIHSETTNTATVPAVLGA